MKRVLLCFAAIGALIAATPALAADLARPAAVPYYKAPQPVAVYGWTGFYIGGNVGWGWLNARATRSVSTRRAL